MNSTVKSYDHFIIKATQVGRMLLNPLDTYISNQLIIHGTWEQYLYPIFKEYIKEGDCVIDIGANIGCHTLLFSNLVGSSGRVHSFEPLEELFFQLKFNCVINKRNNCTLYRLGLLDKMCSIKKNEFPIDKPENFGAQCLNTNENNFYTELDISTQRVDVTTLDILKLQPSFIKIDAEGLEDKILLGGTQTILKFKPTLLVEIHKEDVEKVNKILENLNYKILKKCGPWDYLCISIDK